ncbi:hypothetical protein DENSPDRAFT_836173 [Dentipellis sp. KUC8613]|nr:hypothetical protein DENSPDRAFT_836173 [Dentipellis sp. KUC8613]
MMKQVAFADIFYANWFGFCLWLDSMSISILQIPGGLIHKLYPLPVVLLHCPLRWLHRTTRTECASPCLAFVTLSSQCACCERGLMYDSFARKCTSFCIT